MSWLKLVGEALFYMSAGVVSFILAILGLLLIAVIIRLPFFIAEELKERKVKNGE